VPVNVFPDTSAALKRDAGRLCSTTSFAAASSEAAPFYQTFALLEAP
jgi:hypothetical protein